MKRVMAVGAAAVMGVSALSAVAMAPAASAVPAPKAPAISWGSCPSGYPAGLQCANLRVPLNYQRPNQAKITVVVSRAKATGTPAQRQGVLLVNRGGPGGTGVAYASSVQRRLPDEAKKAYDVIGFDPRGVGLSSPISCVDPSFKPAPAPDPVPSSPAEIAKHTAKAKEYKNGCLANNGAAIRYFDTVSTVRDMDMIRAGLGEQKINYLGYSYGTYLGSVYATMFPKNSRRFVLDSAVDPKKVWYEANLGQNVQFQKVFQEFQRWVANYNSTYQMGATEAAVNKTWNRVRAALKREPAGKIFGPAELDDAATGSMYGDSAWPDLAAAVSDYATKGDDAKLRELYAPTDAAGENGNAVYTTVGCNDKVWPKDLQKWYADAKTQYKKYPILTWSNAWMNMPCAFWPYGAKQAPKVGGPGVPKILLFNAVGDPATPYAGALSMRRALNGSKLVTVSGQTNHGQYLYENNACTMAYGTKYLMSGAMPAKDVTCLGNPHPSPTAAKAMAKPGPDERPGRR